MEINLHTASGGYTQRRKRIRRIHGKSLAVICCVLLISAFWLTKIEVQHTEPPFSPSAPQPDPPVPTQPLPEENPFVLEYGKDNEPEPKEEEEPTQKQRVARYADIEMTQEEEEELAAVVFLESATQSLRGQQAIAEVIFNRVIADNFPDTVHEVLYEGMDSGKPQFSTAPYIAKATPTEQQYLAIEQALYGPSILPDDVVYFSRDGENEYLWGSIEDHVFCFQYPWAVE